MGRCDDPCTYDSPGAGHLDNLDCDRVSVGITQCAETVSWPDGGTTPVRGEKNTDWEGGYRVPAMVRGTGLVPARREINDLFSRRTGLRRWSRPRASLRSKT